MHNNKSIRQDGFEEVYALKMAKQRTIVLKDKKTPGRKRMSDKTAIKEPANATATATLPAATTAAPVAAAAAPKVDIEQLSRNIARMVEEGGKALAAYLKPREDGTVKSEPAEEVADMVKTLGHVAEYWLSDPQRTVEVQASLGKAYLDLWASASRRLAGEATEPVVQPAPNDKRFSDPEWSSNQYYDFLKQVYLLTTQWAERLVTNASGLDPHTRQKGEFYVRQIANALAPTNFVLTNPEVMRATLESNAENLARGMHMLAEDIEAGQGSLRIRQSDASKFAVGKNLALTPGKVIFQNDLMQLIQYTPTTESVLKRPLLIIPPWINKFYILDLNPEKSFIKWCVEHGLTVFVISWVNPDQQQATKDFEHYMREGPLTALDVIKQVTGEDDVNAIGYCVGGTLLAAALALLAQEGDDRIKSATFFTTQVDFTYAGDLKVFVDEDQVAAVEKAMNEKGYLDGTKMATAFNMLRSGDLIWPYVINNYMRGKDPLPFDLLYWNADSTRMAAANHSFYLRNCYLENNLSRGTMELAGRTVSLGDIKIPVYNLATKEDHIAPALSVFVGSRYLGGSVEYVMAGSGHIAGVVNPPAANKYQYWTGSKPVGDFGQWFASAVEHPGSWWTHWQHWVETQDNARVPARKPGKHMKTLGDAPGTYVKVRV